MFKFSDLRRAGPHVGSLGIGGSEPLKTRRWRRQVTVGCVKMKCSFGVVSEAGVARGNAPVLEGCQPVSGVDGKLDDPVRVV